MDPKELFAEVRNFRSSNLRPVETQITTAAGHQYVEKRYDHGAHTVRKCSIVRGYVLDSKADISVALVLPGLILGSQDVAVELQILRDFNVTHILNVGYGIPNYYEEKFIYKNVSILDSPASDIRIFFDGCFQFIDDGRQEGCVLVHCNAGVSRAPTIVIAYIMNRNCSSLDEALSLVKSVRPCVRPNDGFMKTLKNYDKELFKVTSSIDS